MSVTKDIRIKTGASTYDTRDIGAEAQYVDVSRDSNGNIIEDITEPGVVVASTEPLSETLGGLQEKLTFDTAPTQASNNPVTSGGIYTAIQADAALSPTSEKPVQNKIVTTALGNKIDLSVIGTQEPIGDAPSVPYETGSYLVGSDKKLYRVTQDIAITDNITVGTNVEEEPVVVGLDRIQPIETELVDVNNIAGAKNFCPNNATTQTVTDVTFTVNTNGSVGVSGTPAATRQLVLNNGGLMMAKGSYTLSSGSDRVVLQARKQSDSTIIGRSNGYQYPATFTLAADTSVVFNLYTTGTSAISTIAYPMCRMASDPDTTYVPYAMSNREATSQISNLTNRVDAKTLANGVNLTSYTASNPYTTPSDGYAYIYTDTPTSSVGKVFFRQGTSTIMQAGAAGNGASYGRNAIFIKKGMKIYATTEGVNVTVTFISIS